MLNKVILTGRFTAEPKERQVSENTKCCVFTIAVNREKRNGEEEKADFINCVAWNRKAENVLNYCHKGSLVTVEGALRSYSYMKDNKNIYGSEVSAQRVYFIDTKNKNTETEISGDDLIEEIESISDEEIEKIFAGEDLMF